jgi:diacylglycerol kinase family enzyme
LGDSPPTRHGFAQLAGAGWDSRAIELVDWGLKKALGPAAYVIAGLRAMAEFKPRLTVRSPHHPAPLRGELVLIGNGGYYGGPFRLFPKADPRDGRLDVLVFPRITWSTMLEIGYSFLEGTLTRAAGAFYFQTDSFEIEGDPRVWFQLDGDNIGHLPVRFTVARQALRVLIP